MISLFGWNWATIVWDFDSRFKSLWLTKYLLLTWTWDEGSRTKIKTLELGFYLEE